MTTRKFDSDIASVPIDPHRRKVPPLKAYGPHHHRENSDMTIRVAIADDHPVILAGVVGSLSADPSIVVIGAAEDSSALLELLGKNEVDVVVTDYSMPGGAFGDGISLLGFLQRRFPGMPLVVLTAIEGPHVLISMTRAGVNCIVSKADAATDVVQAIHCALTGREFYSPSIRARLELVQKVEHSPLTQRESEVLRLFAEGLQLGEIATRLQRSRQTISTQKRSAMRKLGMSNNNDIYLYAVTHDWVSTSQATRDAASGADSD